MTISVHIRSVSDAGEIGEAFGSAFRRDERVIYEGAGGPVIAEHVAATVQRFRIDELTALSRLAVDGWSNGKMTITADAG